MIKTWVSYLLIALIACQSVIAMADSHSLGNEHAKFEHDHYSDTVNDKSSSKIDINLSAPSHDECHCHMICHLSLSSSQKETKVTVSKQPPAIYHRAYISNIQAPNLRPPIV